MARVPVIQDSAQIDIGTGRQRIQASPDAFGGQEARALQTVQQGISTVARVAEEKDDEFAEAEARELDNELTRRLRDRLTGAEGYLSTQRGRNAIDQRTQIETDVDAIAAEIGERTTNQRARAMYLNAAQARVGDALGRIAEHSARESTSYLNEQSEARLLEFADDAAASYGDEARVLELLNGADGEIRTLGQRRGWDDEIIAQRTRQFRSDVVARTIVLLAETDPAAAEDMFDRYRPSLTAQEAGELRTTIRAAQRQAIDRVEGMAWQAFANGQPLQAMGEDAYREFTTNPLYGQSHARLRDAYRVRAQSYANGERAQNDSPAYWGLRVLSQTDPRRFMETLPQVLASQEGATISRGDTGRLLERYVEIQQGADVGQQRTVFNAVVDTAATALAPYGFDTSDGSSEGQALRAAILREVEGFMSANGGAAPNSEETQALIGRAVVTLPRSAVPGNADYRVRGVPNRERYGRRGNSGSDVRPMSEAVVPYAAIPGDLRLQIGTRLHQRLRRQPTRGEVENAYAAFLQGRPLEVGGGE